MSITQINPDAEEVLLHLSRTELPSQRTKLAIRDTCQLGDRVDVILRSMLERGYLTNGLDGVYTLTPMGRKALPEFDDGNNTQIIRPENNGAAKKATTHEMIPASSVRSEIYIAPPQAPLDDTQDPVGETLYAPPVTVPTVFHHPVRLSTKLLESPPDSRPSVVLRFLLAFDMPKDALPIPVLHGDILGRSRKSDICLRHDKFISTSHVRFEIRQGNGSYKLYVEDLGSRNGAYVDGVKLHAKKAHGLKHGSRLQVGNTVFTVVQIP